MGTRNEKIVASVTLVEALRELLGTDAPRDKSQQVTEPVRPIRVTDSL